MLKLTCPLLALLALTASWPGHAASPADSCNSLSETPLQVEMEPVTVESPVRTDDAKLMTVRTTGTESLDKFATVGTTRTKPRWNVSYELSMKRDPVSARLCYRPAVHVTIGYDPMRISIADVYSRSTCAYDAIVAHEHGHVSIYEHFLPTAARAIEQRIGALGAERMQYAADTATVGRQLSQLTSQISAIVADEMSRSEVLHRHFDSAQEAHRLLNACGGEVRRDLNREVLSWKSADSQSRAG